ncbi:calcium-binding protein [Sphingomonas sp. RB3P16]|uniref:calcium-binding protein n=1 Tax=Parasphingomonas frigoris TaxID=3096163 RepID=UPI002FC943B3
MLLAGCGTKPSNDEYAANFVPPTLLKRAEYETLLESRWTRLDRNLDGDIVQSEIPVKYADRLTALDADHDGKITHREFISGSLARFDREDTNHDGLLTNVESSAARAAEKAAGTAK